MEGKGGVWRAVMGGGGEGSNGLRCKWHSGAR